MKKPKLFKKFKKNRNANETEDKNINQSQEKEEKQLEKPSEKIKSKLISKTLFILTITATVLASGMILYRIYFSKIINQNRYATIISEAKELESKSEYTSALLKYSEAVETISSEPEAYTEIVKILLLKNRPDEAAEIIKSAIINLRDLTSIGELYLELAEFYYRSGNYEKSLEYGKKAIEYGEKDRAYIITTASYLKQGDLSNAKKYHSTENYNATTLESTAISQESIEYKFLSILLVGEDYEYIEENLNLLSGYISDESTVGSTQSSNGNNVIEYENSAHDLIHTLILATKSDWETALQNVITAKENSDDPLYQKTLLSSVYYELGYPGMIPTLLESERESMKNYWDGLYLLGVGYYYLGDYDQSARVLNDAIEAGATDKNVYLFAARSYINIDDKEKADTYYGWALDYSEKNEKNELIYEYAQFREEYYDINSALKILDKISKIEDYLPALLFKAALLSEEERWDEAKKLVDSYPDFDEDYIALIEEEYYKDITDEYLLIKSSILINEGSHDQVEELAESLRNRRLIQDDTYYYIKGLVSFHKGDLTDGTHYLKKAIELDRIGKISEKASQVLAKI